MVHLDKYYTSSELSLKLINITFTKINDNIDCIIEPSAGNGSFSNHLQKLENINLLFFDIEPEKKEIIQQDFLLLQSDKYELDKYKNILCIGNPPFGRQNSLAVKFFNKCSSFENTKYISMIFPKSFRKSSIQNRLNLNFHLIWEEDIPENSFVSSDKKIKYDIPCIFQIWKRETYSREKEKNNKLLEEFKDIVEFTKEPLLNNKLFLSIRRVGFYSGKVEYYNNQSKQSHYFLKCRNENISMKIIEYLNSIEWKHNDTVGPRSISKNKFIEKINIIQF